MRTARPRLRTGTRAGALVPLLVLAALLPGCAGPGYGDGGGYGYGGYDVDYYEVDGGAYGDYGGWGHGYRGGPPRRGDARGGGAQHAFHPAPASRPTPSIPSRARR